MYTLPVVISLLALILSAFALFFSLRFRSSAQNPGIRGDIQIVNDCDGLVASIPDNVKVKGRLYDAQGNYVGDTDNVGPLRADPSGNPIKRGTYNLDVRLPQTMGTPTEWKLWITRHDGTEICPPIACPAAGDCKDQVAKPYVVSYTSWAMTKMIKVACSCDPP